MNNAILHISDLHFVLPIENAKTRFCQDFEKTFIDSCKAAESKNDIKIKYLVISGDIANNSKEKEYEKALSFLNKLISEIKIDINNVLICPGNHDISWPALETAIEELSITDENKVFEEHDIKFKHFILFYFMRNSLKVLGKNLIPN